MKISIGIVKIRIGNVKIFYFRFLTDWHLLGCPEHDFTIFTKCLAACRSACLFDTNFVATLEQKLMGRFAWNFISNCSLIWIRADKSLVYIDQEVPLLFEIFDFYNTMV